MKLSTSKPACVEQASCSQALANGVGGLSGIVMEICGKCHEHVRSFKTVPINSTSLVEVVLLCLVFASKPPSVCFAGVFCHTTFYIDILFVNRTCSPMLLCRTSASRSCLRKLSRRTSADRTYSPTLSRRTSAN